MDGPQEIAEVERRVIARFVWSASLVIGVFASDLLIPAGILIPILYVIPILLAFRFLEPRHVVLIVGLSGLFTIVGLFLSPTGAPGWISYANRALALMTILAMCAVYVKHQQTAARLHVLHELLPQCASCKKVRDDVGYWTQLELYLEEHGIQQFTHSLCPGCERDYQQELLDLKLARHRKGC